MISLNALWPFAVAVAMGLIGYIGGLLYFSTLCHTVSLMAAGGPRRYLMVSSLVRILAAGAVLTVAARLGAYPLLATFVGFLLARSRALRTIGRTP